jgi:hypothetical protein
MGYDLIPDRDALHFTSDGIDDARRIAPANVEVVWFASLLASGDDVYRDTAGSPNVVEVDARGHYPEEDFIRTEVWNVDNLGLERRPGITEPGLSYDLGVHLGWNLTDGWQLTDVHGLSHSYDPLSRE